ncbi:MAG: hypothetical protein ACK5NY_10915 [Burkholderiaceae bacterium]
MATHIAEVPRTPPPGLERTISDRNNDGDPGNDIVGGHAAGIIDPEAQKVATNGGGTPNSTPTVSVMQYDKKNSKWYQVTFYECTDGKWKIQKITDDQGKDITSAALGKTDSNKKYSASDLPKITFNMGNVGRAVPTDTSTSKALNAFSFGGDAAGVDFNAKTATLIKKNYDSLVATYGKGATLVGLLFAIMGGKLEMVKNMQQFWGLMLDFQTAVAPRLESVKGLFTNNQDKDKAHIDNTEDLQFFLQLASNFHTDVKVGSYHLSQLFGKDALEEFGKAYEAANSAIDKLGKGEKLSVEDRHKMSELVVSTEKLVGSLNSGFSTSLGEDRSLPLDISKDAISPKITQLSSQSPKTIQTYQDLINGWGNLRYN